MKLRYNNLNKKNVNWHNNRFYKKNKKNKKEKKEKKKENKKWLNKRKALKSRLFKS
jgi:hypothetical protein